MTYFIKHYDGTPIVAIPDGTINQASLPSAGNNSAATSISIPGRNYPNYGTPIIENMIYMLENFAGSNEPNKPLRGQLWYDTANHILKVRDNGQWIGTGKVLVQSTVPSTTTDGQLWYDTARKQIFAYDSTLSSHWQLLGPIGAANSANTIATTVPNSTTVDVVQITDLTAATHNAVRVVVGGTLIALVSKDTYSTTVSGFANIIPGLNINTSLTGINMSGKAGTAGVADSAKGLVGLDITKIMTTDKTNVPDSSAFDLGSAVNRYGNVYAGVFHGTATAAQYADLAERYHADEFLEPGTVVSIGGECEITRSRTVGSSDVFGVVSTQPGLMLNSAAGSNETHPYVALSGRAPVRVVGRVLKGARLMSSSLPGVAQKWEPQYGMLAILGRALDNKTTDSIDLVEAVIGNR